MTFTVKSLKRGIRRGHRCVARTRRHHKGHPCTRKVRVRGSFAQRGKVGNNSLRFTGRLGHRRLRSGRYVLTATPRGATGRGKTRSASFRVLG